MRLKKISLLYICCSGLLAGCAKFLDIDPPINTVTTDEMFTTNKQADWAVAGIYSKMINGQAPTFDGRMIAFSNYAAGLSTLMGGLSADELTLPSVTGTDPFFPVYQNKLAINTPGYSTEYWTSAYKVIYDANAAIEGLSGSASSALTDSARNQLTGEALALRAFSYFYLVNFFGDVPLALSTDFNQTVKLSRSPVETVYQQIIADLVQARSLLNTGYTIAGNERVRINKWFAEAMLARVYLYNKSYSQAIESAGNVIAENGLFRLEPLPNVFLANSREAILQLKPTNQTYFNNATPEGYAIGYDSRMPQPNFALTTQLTSSFEPGDKRKQDWTAENGGWTVPDKYKTRMENSAPYGPQPEYYTVMRLAELYLIRAEASILLTDGNTTNAINDLNALRQRADVPLLENTLTAAEVKSAIEHERQIELFAEWGHRWLDLKRTGRAAGILPDIAYKQPWLGDYQLLYPIPPSEIASNGNLSQNPDYNR